MGEEGGVEVKTVALFLCPLNPVGEIVDGKIVSGMMLFGIHGVQIDLVLKGGERAGHVDIAAELVAVAGGAGIAAGYEVLAFGLNAFKAVNIIALPAVHGDFDLSKLLQYLFHIYAPVFIYGFGAFVILEDLFLCHR